MSILLIGSTGDAVTQLQRDLAKLGFALSGTGYFGSKTQDAVESIQRNAGLDVDGEVGEKTLAVIAEKLSQKADVQPLPGFAGGAPHDLAEIRSKILATSSRFLGLTEMRNNAQWSGGDRGEALKSALLETGWEVGWAYCIAFCEVCWRVGYEGRPELEQISKLITPSVMQTYHNFAGRISRMPDPGAIAFWQHGTSALGHAGIVTMRSGAESFHTNEGNTTPAPGTVREGGGHGDGVFAKSHRLDFTRGSMTLLGFLNPWLA